MQSPTKAMPTRTLMNMATIITMTSRIPPMRMFRG